MVKKLHIVYLEAHLYSENEFVLLKQTPGGVNKHRVGDTVYEVIDTGLHFFCRLSTIYSFLKHHTEGLKNIYFFFSVISFCSDL